MPEQWNWMLAVYQNAVGVISLSSAHSQARFYFSRTSLPLIEADQSPPRLMAKSLGWELLAMSILSGILYCFRPSGRNRRGRDVFGMT
jgi:hypothetical protein